MINDLTIASLCSALYSEPSKMDQVLNIDSVCIGIKHYPDAYVAIMRGSYTMLDWIRDIASIAVVDTPDIGLVGAGFYKGIPDALKALNLHAVDKPIYLGGHSLGAAHACILGGKAVAAGIRIQKITLFGCPRPAGEKLKYVLSGTEIASYKNLSDPVTCVPLPPLVTHVRDMTAVNIAPPSPDSWGIFSDHHIFLYERGMQNLFGATK